MKLFEEIRRRNVHRFAVAYIAGAWLLIQVVGALFPVFGYSDAAIRMVVIILAIGFFPAVILSWFFEWTEKGILKEAERSAEFAPRSTTKFDRIITVTLVLAVGYFAFDKFILDPRRDSAQVEQVTEQVLASMSIDLSEEESIAVLPFTNMSSDPEQAYFADGLSEDLVNLLTKISELRVISRSTASTFKGKEISIPEMAKQMGVANILSGSVRKNGDQIRVTVQLIDATTDSNLWSETYDRTLKDVFKIQNEISAHVVSELKLRLMDGIPAADEIDPEAYELYLQARYIMHTSQDSSLIDEAIEKLKLVLESEPNFVPAVHELARSYLRILQTMSQPNRLLAMRTVSDIRKQVEHLIDIAPDSGYTNGWIAFMAQNFEQDYQKAATYRERSIVTSTDSILYTNLLQATTLLIPMGREAEALAILEYIVSRDPACSPCVTSLTRMIRTLGRPREAAERLESIYQWHSPGPSKYEQLGYAWLFANEPEKALGYFEQVEDQEQFALAKAGKLVALFETGKSEIFEKEFETYRQDKEHQPSAIAAIYAATAQYDEAFIWLDKMVKQDGSQSAGIVMTEVFNSLRSDPRWDKFIEDHKVKQPDFSHIVFNPKLPSAVEAMLETVSNAKESDQLAK